MLSIIGWFAVLGVALYALTKGADLFIDNAKKLGLMLGLSPFVVGVLIVGVGTSFPELATGIAAVFRGASEIVVANAIGSNITNILLIVGLLGTLAGRIVIGKDLLKHELPIFVVATIHFIAIAFDGVIDRVEGLLLLGTYAVYVAYLLSDEGGEGEVMQARAEPRNTNFSWQTIGLLFVGLTLVLVGAKYAVDSVIVLATLAGIPVVVISITAVALGTSLPELFVSLFALKDGNLDLAIGNIFGSNAFNLLMAVGIPAVITPLTLGGDAVYFGLGIMAAASIIFFVNGLARKIDRWEGLMFLLFYAFFIIKIFGM